MTITFTWFFFIGAPASCAQNATSIQSSNSSSSSTLFDLSNDNSFANLANPSDFAFSSSDFPDTSNLLDQFYPFKSQNDWVHRWLRAVDKARSKQPHYVAPLITTHVDLVQQFRFDSYQEVKDGIVNDDFGSMKGLEIIPNTRMEVQVGIPPYMEYRAPNMPDGFGDVSIFMKFRAFSAPEHRGDYFVGFFLGGEFPSATPPNGKGHTIWTPMIAAAKGWTSSRLAFDYQTNFGADLPQSGTATLGRDIIFNNTFQFGIKKHLWPEVESNTTFFVDGPKSGDTENFVTPGLLIGPFDIGERLHFEFGGGVQIAVTKYHEYDHRWIWTFRFPF